MTRDDLHKLAAPFPKAAVSWRAQTLTRDGDKALALAYIDARDVMNRLDEVCGPENWQSKIEETAKGRVLATISIRIDGEWVAKCDGAGATDIEGDKGGISDSLKRCAVQWGIARYLYDIESPWVPCEAYEANGKKHWRKWTADPWLFVRNAPQAPAAPVEAAIPASVKAMLKGITECHSINGLQSYYKENIGAIPEEHHKTINQETNRRKKEIEQVELVNA